jgi:hypothetical protein
MLPEIGLTPKPALKANHDHDVQWDQHLGRSVHVYFGITVQINENIMHIHAQLGTYSRK